MTKAQKSGQYKETPTPSARQMLGWYDQHRRDLPWRAHAGVMPDPYHVWLSEMMLQQTTVAAVIPHYTRFLARWPRVQDLAAAPLEDVMAAWAGLGYYRRARMLHESARHVTTHLHGVFPQNETELRLLPGVGPYTAAAIAAIAFGQCANVVDGNIERVMARIFAVGTPLPGAKAELKRLAADLVPAQRCGDYAQALMDLGATVCTPRQPKCGRCPWQKSCRAQAQGIAADLPVRNLGKAKPVRTTTAFWLVNRKGEILLQRRPPQGLLGGMVGVPTSVWREEPFRPLEDVKSEAPATAVWKMIDGEIRHSFTHFDLHIRIARGTTRNQSSQGLWIAAQDVGRQGLPSVMRKIVNHVMGSQ